MTQPQVLGQVIAERKYVLLGDSVSKKEIIVRIGRPQELGSAKYACPFEIVGIDPPRIRSAFGGDALQSLQLVFKIIGAYLHSYRARYGAGFYLHEEGDDLGFPAEAWTDGPASQIVKSFAPLYGLKLSISRNAASMKTFHLGTIRPHPTAKGTVGQYALHIQCPWRLVVAACAWKTPTENLVVTGSNDWWEPAERRNDLNWSEWNKHRMSPSLQQVALAELFTEYEESTKSWINISDQLIVEQVEADDYGGLDIHLSGGYRLQVFPDGKKGEQWRLLEPGEETPHLVMEDGILSGFASDQNTDSSETY